ncbi:hypothetical protein KJY78_04740 [Canibacter sp. lx-45]|uniref:hypothetical protein n=1 Tax=Canibacter zhuwentaonis TaxID=2837491 RepID=UPI001BDDC3C6|nr:hypothetical protein [Canibacter zhuwentaonis]MBT1035654.1 hypothetical protein [Canibacter zhuwentaonis]
MSTKKSRTISRAVTSVLLLCLLLGAFWAYSNRQHLSNFISAQTFNASGRIAEIAQTLEFTNTGKIVFYATHPAVHTGLEFKESCSHVTSQEATHVLGCYLPKSNRINLLSVADERLNGIMEVSAAHETLHSVWQQLPQEERDTLAEKLQKLYDQMQTSSPDFVTRMSVYSDLPRHSFQNELHSIMGTELDNLPEWLENHYAKWFQNRHKIVKLHRGYDSVFKQLQEESDDITATLKSMHEEYSTRQAQLQQDIVSYNSDFKQFIQRNENYEFSDDEALFYRTKAAYELRRSQIEQEIEELQKYAVEYENLRAELNEIHKTSAELSDLLDSNLAELNSAG